MADRKLVLQAELHAHAQQLLAFAREHDVGFVLMLVDRDKSFNVCTNLNDAQKRVIAEGWLDQMATPIRQSFHGPGGEG